MKITKTIRMLIRNSLRIVALILALSYQVLTSMGSAQNQSLTLVLENKPLKVVLSAIESKAKVVFFYNDKDVDLNRLVKINVTNQSLIKVLDEVFKNSSNDYRIDNKQIYITKKKTIVSVKQPLKTNIVTGKVIDEKGEALIGASILVKGENRGVITDINGKFSVETSDHSELVVSYISYDSKTVPVNGRNQIQVILQESNKTLQDVIVVGYGHQKKESVVGAIAQTKGDDLMRTGITTNVGQTLTGLLPGVETITTTGMPGQEDPTIRIRGLSSWNGSSPLVLIDGVERSMSDIDVGQIESISVLKDASATAVFGVKGAEGVILITTKRGKEGKAQVSFSSSLTAKFISRMPRKMDSYDAFSYQNEVLEKANAANSNNWSWYMPQQELRKYRYPVSPSDPYNYPNVDWADEIVKSTAMTQRYDINITGGTNFAKYFAALSYVKDDDLLKSGLNVGLPYTPKWGFEHYNFRSNIDLNITKSTVFSANLAGSVRIKNGFDNAVTHIWSAFYQLSPAAYPVRYPDGTFGYNTNKPNDMNPIRILSGSSGLSTAYTTQLSSDFTLKQNFDFVTQGLSAQASLSYDNGLYSASSISYIDLLAKSVSKTGVVDYNPVNGGNDMDYFQVPGSLNAESFSVGATTRRLYYKGQVNYTRTFGLHDVTALALMSREELTSGSEFPHYREDWVGRLTYGYAEKYFIEVNGAYNGSEKFAPKYRFAFFPSVGLGWMLSNEKFMKFDWLEKLKIRYSIGKVGSDNFASSRWAYMSGWSMTGAKVPFGTTFEGPGAGVGATYPEYTESAVGNPDLHWEVSQKQNFGLDFSIFKGIFSGSFEVFRDDRSDVFLSADSRSYSTPAYFGAAPVAANIGKVLNQGFELDVKLQNTWSGLHAWTRVNFSMAKDKVIYAEDPALRPDYQKNAGFQIGQPKALVEQPGYTKSWDEVYGSVGFETNAQRLPGGVVNVDYNGDGVINANDQIATGYPNRPQDTYNFFLGADYKGFSFMVQFLGGYNISQWVNSYTASLDNKSPTISSSVSDYWTPTNQNATYPLGSVSATRNMLIDASFLRLKNVELSYTLSNHWLKLLRISAMKLTLSGNDLILWSRLPDDREQSVDIWSQTETLYPTLKRLNLGLNLTF
ncbi:MAG: TonB-dependent receptor [Bacteroidota bacterium]|nr:TonB-dependent receptor [Bacteroidota bacterium]